MGRDRIGTRIETLIQQGRWKQAERAIRKQLDKEPDDHWLWSRLSGVKYEQHDYQGALEAAEKALDIVPDCPLAGWSYAGALVFCLSRNWNLPSRELAAILSRRNTHASATSSLHA